MRWGVGIFVSWLMITQSFGKGYQTFEEKGKIGMKDEAGHVVLPPAFEALGWSDGSFSVIGEVTGYRQEGAWGIINLKKEFITKAEYESLVYSGGDCLIARKKINPVVSKTGCINLKGEVKIPFIYDGITIQGLRAIVFNLIGAHYYFGLTDLDNRILLPVVYKNISPLGTLRFAVENSNNKIALFNDEGKAVTDFSIDSASVFYRGYAILYQDNLQGLIDRESVVKLKPLYDAIKINEGGEVWASLPNEIFCLSSKNEAIQQISGDALTPTGEHHWILQKGALAGIVNNEFQIEVPIEYNRLSEIAGGIYLAKRNQKMGVITVKGDIIIPFSFDSLIKENRCYRGYSKTLGWQLLNETGKQLTERYYDQLMPSTQLGFPAVNRGFSGLVNFEGHEFIHCVFDSIAPSVAGLMTVKFKGNYGIINANEDWQVAPQVYPLSTINEHCYLQRQPGNNFVKSFTGEILYFTPYPMQFNSENFVEFLPDKTEKTISYRGELIQRTTMPGEVEVLFPEREGLRGIKKDGRYGFVDQRGRLRIANRYDSIGEFHEGLAAVKLIGKWGFVNTSDQIVVNPNYDNCSLFQNGRAIVSRYKKFGVIGPLGTPILPLRYDAVKRQPDGKFLLTTSALQGLADEQCNVLVEPRFSVLTEASNGLLVACREGKCGAITSSGLSVIPMIYDRLNYVSSRNIFLAEKKSAWKQIEIK